MKNVIKKALAICVILSMTILPVNAFALLSYANTDVETEFVSFGSDDEQKDTIILDANGGQFGELLVDENSGRFIISVNGTTSMEIQENKLSMDLIYSSWNLDSDNNMIFYFGNAPLGVVNFGKYLLGWSTDGTKEHIITELPGKGTRLYAVWTDACTIRYIGKNFTEKGLVMTKANKSGSDMWMDIIYAAGIKVGYIRPMIINDASDNNFSEIEVKWAFDPEGRNLIEDISEYIPDRSVTLYAIPPNEGGALGDVNGDKKVDSKDLTTLAKHVARITQITDSGLHAAADVNGDDKIDSKDLTHLAKYVAKIIPEL